MVATVPRPVAKAKLTLDVASLTFFLHPIKEQFVATIEQQVTETINSVANLKVLLELQQAPKGLPEELESFSIQLDHQDQGSLKVVRAPNLRA